MGLSGTKFVAGCVVSPRRSRTMLSYSTREMRRRGDQATVGDPGTQSAVSLMSFVLTGSGARLATVPPSSAPASASDAVPRSSDRWPPFAHPDARAPTTTAVATSDGNVHRTLDRLAAVT